MNKRDYYDILGLARNASDSDIKTSYRKLASKYHPDRLAEGDKEAGEIKFKEAKEAYETLSDPEKRQQYDLFGHKGPSQSSFTDRTYGSGNEYVDEFIRKAFGNRQHFRFDNGMFTQTNARPTLSINIRLEDAYNGRTVVIDKTTITIPKGIRSGTRLFAGTNFYRIDIQQHHKFKRSDDDLLVDIDIGAIEAILGIDATLEHLDGSKLQFTIPAGIQPGQIIKLSNKGMKNPETDIYGDLLVRISVMIPKDLTDAEKETIRIITHRDSINI